MTLRVKINLIVGTLTLLFVVLVLTIELRSMRHSVNEEVVAANRVAAQLLNRTALLHAARGTPAMRDFLEGIGRVRSNEITLFDSNGDELYRSPPSPYKAGRDAPSWFERLVAPKPSVQSILFPDGKLEVRANASRAIVDAWDDARVLVIGGASMLVLLATLMHWLVGRTVRPFDAIVRALNRVQAGEFDVRLPRLAGAEAGAIGAAFNRMVGELHTHLETERRAIRAEAQLSDSRSLARWIDNRVEAERRLIARELHDEFGQSVTAMRSMALSIAHRVQATDLVASQAARTIADESSRLYDAMHGIIPRLTPLMLDNLGLADALRDLAERAERARTGARITVEVDLADTPLAGDAALALYRAAQEGVTNALRHGGADLIELSLSRHGSDIVLRVVDNGHGLDPAAAAEASGATGAGGTGGAAPTVDHYGLRWIGERVGALAGSVALEPGPERGAVLIVRMPVGPSTEAA
ncbi:MAG: HAMP domain-containing protein [Burkholderiaceae bacterium]